MVALNTAERTGYFSQDDLAYPDWIASSRFLGGILVFIGLIGTVFGIAFAITALGDANTTNSQMTIIKQISELKNSLDLVLADMSTAFTCTLCGLTGTLVISFFNAGYMGAARRLAREVEKYWETNSLSTLTLGKLPANPDLQAVISELTRSIQVGLPTGTLARVEGRLTTIADSLHRANSVPDSQVDLVAIVGLLQNLVQQLQPVAKSLISTYEALPQALLHAGTVLQETVGGMQSQIDRSTKQLAEVGQITQATLNELKNFQPTLVSAASTLTEAMALITEAAYRFQSTVSTISTASESLNLATDSLRDEQKRVIDILERANTSVAAEAKVMSGAVQKLSNDLRNSDVEQRESLRVLVAHLETLNNDHKVVLDDLESALLDLAAVAENADLRNQLKSLIGHIAGFQEALDTDDKRRLVVQAQFQREHEIRWEEAQNDVRKLTNRIDASTNGLATMHTELTATLNRLEHGAQTSADLLQRFEAQIKTESQNLEKSSKPERDWKWFSNFWKPKTRAKAVPPEKRKSPPDKQ